MKNKNRILIFSMSTLPIIFLSSSCKKIDPKIDEEELKRQEEQRKADEEIQRSDNNIVIPTKFKGKSVEEIGVEAFKNLTIQTIFIPSSIKLISNFAFANSKLSNVNMHEGLITIETKAF
ncbi:hypothetical protein PFMG_04978, partial [Plasmodium falciparum IGH-CR14]